MLAVPNARPCHVRVNLSRAGEAAASPARERRTRTETTGPSCRRVREWGTSSNSQSLVTVVRVRAMRIAPEEVSVLPLAEEDIDANNVTYDKPTRNTRFNMEEKNAVGPDCRRGYITRYFASRTGQRIHSPCRRGQRARADPRCSPDFTTSGR